MIALLIVALVFFGSVSLVMSGLKQLFGSRPDSGVHITYNVTIQNSFNGRTDDRGTHKTEAADEFGNIFNRTRF